MDQRAFLQPRVDKLAADLDVIFFGIGLCSQLRYNLAVDGNFASRNQFFGVTPRSKAGVGNEFLKSLLHKTCGADLTPWSAAARRRFSLDHSTNQDRNY